MYLDDPWKLAACIAVVLVIGVSKGGFAGLGALATPIMALAFPPMIAVGIILPVLISQDILSVWSFRREWDRWIIAWMLPDAIAGIAVGWLFASRVDERIFTVALGAVTFVFALYRLWVDSGHKVAAPSTSPGWVGALFGFGTGLTSQVAHAGAPPFQMWVTPRKLPHNVYVGTNAVLFAVINWLKVPAYLSMGALTRPVLETAALLIPLALIVTFLTLRYVRRLASGSFYTAVYWLMALLGAALVIRQI